MKDLIHQKIEQSIRDRKETHKTFIDKVAAYKPFLEVEDKAFGDGAISGKHKELMGLSIAIITKCEPCMEWHMDQALQNGASDEEIYETIGVAIEMGGGQAAAYARFAIKALEYFRNQ